MKRRPPVIAARRWLTSAIAALLLAACAPRSPVETNGPRAAIPATAADLGFIVIGDWGERGHPGQRSVAHRMSAYAREARIDFIISTGDNFYPRGVANVSDPRWQDTFGAIYALPGIAELRWFVVLGNHDYQGSYRAQIAYGEKNPRWVLPATYHYTVERIDANTWATFAFLDTSAFIANYRRKPEKYLAIETQDAAAQLSWLDAVLGCAPPGWKLVVGHHPVYSGSDRQDEVDDMQDHVLPLLRRHGAHVYFAGHDHHLEHVKPEGPTHFVVSGGGFGGEPNAPSPHSRFQMSTAGFVAAAVGRSRMEMRFIGERAGPLYLAIVERDATDSRVVEAADGAGHLPKCMAGWERSRHQSP